MHLQIIKKWSPIYKHIHLIKVLELWVYYRKIYIYRYV